MTRDELLALARQAGIEVHERKQQARIGIDVITGEDSTAKLARFAQLLEARVLAYTPPAPIVVKAADIDPELLRDMLAKSPPMSILPMPPEPDVAAAVAAERRKHQADIERWKGEAAKAEKWRALAMEREGANGRVIEEVQREAAAEEREACAQVCDATYHKHIGPEYGEVRFGIAACAAAIRARGQKGGAA